MKQRTLINTIQALDYLESLLKGEAIAPEDLHESKLERSKQEVSECLSALEEALHSVNDFEVDESRGEEKEFFLIPARVMDWNKPSPSGSRSMIMKHEACTCRIKSTDTETGETKEIGDIAGAIGGGLEVTFSGEENGVHYRLENRQLWNAVAGQTNRKDLKLD